MLWIASIVCGGLVGGVIYGFYRKRKYLAQAASTAAPLNNSLA